MVRGISPIGKEKVYGGKDLRKSQVLIKTEGEKMKAVIVKI